MSNKFIDFLSSKGKKLKISKYENYYEIYNNHFRKYKNTNPIILEIGVQGGGSLEMWNYYFDNKCEIYGIDIDPKCLKVPEKLNASNVKITIGDQGDKTFWSNFIKNVPKFDIVIDDGGHTMNQQIVTFQSIYNHMKEDSTYLCEDLHTSYWREFGGGLKKPNSFIEYSKNLIDTLNSDHWRKENVRNSRAYGRNSSFARSTHSMHYYDSILIFEKRKTQEMKASNV